MARRGHDDLDSLKLKMMARAQSAWMAARAAKAHERATIALTNGPLLFVFPERLTSRNLPRHIIHLPGVTTTK